MIGVINIKNIIKVLCMMIFTLLIVGCSKKNSKEIYKELVDKLEDLDSYTLEGELQMFNDDNSFKYNVTVNYLEDDNFKVDLINKSNNHRQIILRNNDGVYVITPSLNKSFKFQSEWPYNSSQSYILSSLLKDLENDSNVVFEEKDEKYILSSTVNYPNNSSLVSQKIIFNKEMIPEKVEVFNKEGIANITFKISKIDFKPKFDENNFEVESTSESVDNKDVSSIDQVLYPMYLPTGTKLQSEETVKSNDSERIILTFAGDKSFTLIEEVSKTPKEFEVTTTSGELVFYENVLGSLTDTSINWSMNGRDYYIIGDNLTNEELLKVAASTSVVSLTK